MKSALLFLILAVTGAAATAPEPSILHLQRGERIHVRFRSEGCFHHFVYEFDLEGGDAVVARSNGGRSVTLSSAERAGLDRLLAFYRQRKTGLCTTQDNVALTYFRAGQKVSSEHYIDGTCSGDELKQVLRFTDIARQLGIE
jgi:hypothetical protein